MVENYEVSVAKYWRACGRTENGKQGPVLEDIIEKTYQALLRPGCIAVDGGAHIGRHTLPMAFACRPGGMVFAFEVLPNQLQRLQQRIAACNLTNVRVVDKALSSVCGKDIQFHHSKTEPARSGIMMRRGLLQHDVETLEVKSISLDELLGHEVRLTFVKLDLEGGEYHALLGGRDVLRRSDAMIIFENGGELVANIYGYTKDDFFALFTDLGYELYSIYGSRYTASDWENPNFPFYTIAARGASMHDFMRDLYPSVLNSVLDQYLVEA